LNSAILMKTILIIQEFKPKMSWRWYSTRKRTSEWFIFTYFCSKRGRQLSHTKMLIDASGHNTQMLGYMVCLHNQNSGNYNRGRNAQDHFCQHCKVYVHWQNKITCTGCPKKSTPVWFVITSKQVKLLKRNNLHQIEEGLT
jgi:hypothetical protein